MTLLKRGVRFIFITANIGDGGEEKYFEFVWLGFGGFVVGFFF